MAAGVLQLRVYTVRAIVFVLLCVGKSSPGFKQACVVFVLPVCMFTHLVL